MVRIRPTGFAGKAFAGGIAKGFMDARAAKQAQENFDREMEIKEEQNRIQEAYYKSKTIEENLRANVDKSLVENKNKTSTGLQLFTKGENGGPAKAGDYYYHAEGTSGQSASELAYLRNNQLLQALTAGGTKAEQLKFSIQQNPDAWKSYYMDNYDAMTDFTMPEKDSDESVGYYVRTKPLPGSNIDDKLKHAPLFDLIGGLQDAVTTRNDQVIQQFGGTNQLKTDGTMSYLKYQDKAMGYDDPTSSGYKQMVTKYAFFKNGQPIDDSIQVSQEQFNTLTESGYLNSQAWKQTTFADKIQVIKGLNDLGKVGDEEITLAYLMNNESQVLGFDNIKTAYETIGSDSPAMLEFAAKLNNIGQKLLQGNPRDTGKNGIAARSSLAMGMAAAAFVGATDKRDVNALSNRVYDIQVAGNKITVKKKNGLQVADDTAIRTATMAASTADKGIKLAKSILDDQELIQNLNNQSKIDYTAAIGGNILGDTFDKTIVFKEVIEQIPSLIQSAFGIGKGSENVTAINGILSSKDFKELQIKAMSGDDPVAMASYEKAQEAGQIYLNNMKELNQLISKSKTPVEKQIYQARARMEAKKVRLAFQVASLVQGGGTGGGRTISNADFEFIYNSLYGKTATTFKQNIEDVMHDLSRERVMSLIIQKYGSTGQHLALLNGVGAYMDASYGLATNRKYISGDKRISDIDAENTVEGGETGGGNTTATTAAPAVDLTDVNQTFPQLIANLDQTGFADGAEATALLKSPNETKIQYRRRIRPLLAEKVIAPVYANLTRENNNVPPPVSVLKNILINEQGFNITSNNAIGMKTLNDSLDLFYKGLTDQNFGAIDETASTAFQLTQTINPFGERETAITNVDARVKKIASNLGTGNNVDGEFDGSYGPGTSPIANKVVGFFQSDPKERDERYAEAKPAADWFYSEAAILYFRRSPPNILEMARKNPIDFYYEFIAPKEQEGQQ